MKKKKTIKIAHEIQVKLGNLVCFGRFQPRPRFRGNRCT